MTSIRARIASVVLAAAVALLAATSLSWTGQKPAPALADSIPVTVPDVGAAPVPSLLVADSIPVTVPDVG